MWRTRDALVGKAFTTFPYDFGGIGVRIRLYQRNALEPKKVGFMDHYDGLEWNHWAKWSAIPEVDHTPEVPIVKQQLVPAEQEPLLPVHATGWIRPRTFSFSVGCWSVAVGIPG